MLTHTKMTHGKFFILETHAGEMIGKAQIHKFQNHEN